RSRRRRRLTWAERCRDLAALNASLTDELAGADDRLSFLLTYWRAVGDASVTFRQVCSRIQRRTQKLLRRSSIREQRLPARGSSQPLYWVEGEKMCVSAMGRHLLDQEEVRKLAYSNSSGVSEQYIILASGQRAKLTARRTIRPLGRLVDALRGRRWQSPECRRAGHLLREERLGHPRRLLAFGQSEDAW